MFEIDFVQSLLNIHISGLVSVFMVWQNASIEVSKTEKIPSSTYLKAKDGGSVIIFSDVDGLLISVVLVLHEG